MVTPTPTNSNFISIPKDETTPWGAAGVQAAWRAEAAALTASKISITANTMIVNSANWKFGPYDGAGGSGKTARLTT